MFMNSRFRISFIVAGSIFAVVGLAFCALPTLQGGEKSNALFVFGHWFDCIWELGLPSLAVGLLLCGVAQDAERQIAFFWLRACTNVRSPIDGFKRCSN